MEGSMTPKEAQAAVELIRRVAGDDEMAHAMEDDFHRLVLEHVAMGGRNIRQLATIALSTQDIQFARWCA
jgi:hypothetical protein